MAVYAIYKVEVYWWYYDEFDNTQDSTSTETVVANNPADAENKALKSAEKKICPDRYANFGGIEIRKVSCLEE